MALLSTLNAINAHPIASKIPLGVLNEFFASNELSGGQTFEINESLFNIFSKNFAEMISFGKNSTVAQKIQYWVLLASIQKIDLNQMLQLIDEWDIPHYSVLCFACITNHIEFIKIFDGAYDPDRYHLFDYFSLAIENQHLELARFLAENRPTLKTEMIARREYRVFRQAALNGHLHVLQFLESLAPDKINNMIQAHSFQAFRYAAEYGHLNIIKYLIEKLPHRFDEMMLSRDYLSMTPHAYPAFVLAARHGHLDIIDFLIKEGPYTIQEIIEKDGACAFQDAALQGHMDVIQFIVRHAESSESIHHMISACEYAAFRMAAAGGHLEILQFIRACAPELMDIMIYSNQYESFQEAAKNGHLQVVEFLVAHAHDQLQNMISTKFYLGFENAASNGHLPIIQYIASLLPHQLENMILSFNYSPFRKASQNGHLEVIEFFAQHAPREIKAMIKSHRYEAFRLACQNNHIRVVESLIYLASPSLNDLVKHPSILWSNPGSITRNQIPKMFASENYQAFRLTINNGNIPLMKLLIEHAPGQVNEMIASDNFAALSIAAENGRLDIIKLLINATPQLTYEMISCQDYKAFSLAAYHGHLDILMYFEELLPGHVSFMISANNYSAFQMAVKGCHLNVIHYLERLSGEYFHNMLAAGHYQAFNIAAHLGHLPVLEYLINKIPTSGLQRIVPLYFHLLSKHQHTQKFAKQFFGNTLILDELEMKFRKTKNPLLDSFMQERWEALLKSKEFFYKHYPHQVFNVSLESAHQYRIVLRYFMNKNPSYSMELMEIPELRKLIGLEYIDLIEVACSNRLSDILMKLLEIETVQDPAPSFPITKFAAQYGYLRLLKRVFNRTPDAIQLMISDNDYHAFRLAASHGHLNIMQYFAELYPAKLPEMIRANQFECFKEASRRGYFCIIEYIASELPDSLHEMISQNRYHACREAAKNGHLEVLMFLNEHLNQTQRESMAIADYFEVFRWCATHQKCHQFAKYLLNIQIVFEHAENHMREYPVIVNDYIDEQLARLKQHKQAFETQYPQEVFDVSRQEAMHYRLMWRRLIRRRAPQDAMLRAMLIEIPNIRQLATYNDNELFRLALSEDNFQAITEFFNIAEVLGLAAREQMYSPENQASASLEAIAQDNENSMRSFNQSENNRLKTALAHYEPQLQTLSCEAVIQELKAEITQRYMASPAQLNQQNLPFSWSDFKNLPLPPQERKQALQAYYQHRTHTAYRYLLKPNHWLASNASFVDTQRRGAFFEDYLPFIAILYLAARDISFPPIDGYTIETRIEALIDELAYINRAHNWDKNDRAFAYDDLEGDKPSCFSGTKRRLFQAARGHELFKILNIEDMDFEIYSYFKAHIQHLISQTPEMISIYHLYQNGEIPSKAQEETLTKYNLTIQDTQRIIAVLKERNPGKIDGALEQYIDNKIKNTRVHLCSWWSCSQINTIIENHLSLLASQNSQRLFVSAEKEDAISEMKPSP